MGPRLCSSGPTNVLVFEGGGEKQEVNVPAQVCEFLVDSFQRHREGCMCCLRGWRLLVSSIRISKGAANGVEVAVSARSMLATKTRERLCREYDADDRNIERSTYQIEVDGEVVLMS